MAVAPRWRAAILAVAALLLAAVALGSRGSPEGPLPILPGAGAGQAALDALLWSAAASLLILGIVAVVLRATGRGGRQPRSRHPFHVRMLAVIGLVAAFIAAVVLASTLHLHSGASRAAAATPAPSPGAALGFSTAGPHQVATFPWAGLFAGVAAIVAVMAIALVLLARSRLEKQPSGTDTVEEASPPVRAVDAAIDALDRERDPRRAVIAAYTTMERLLGAAGSPRRMADAPTEHLERSLILLGAGRGAARRLTELFERARFSRHDIDETVRGAALAALAAVRRDLEPA